MPSPEVDLAIFTALKEEYAAVERALPSPHPHIVLLRGGVGPLSAAAAAKKLLEHKPQAIVSCGFCGGLSPEPKLGDVILADKVLDGSGDGAPIACDAGRLQLWRTALERANVPFHTGALANAGSAVTSCEAKRELGARCGALAVDMESYAIGSEARRAGVSFVVLRVISDTSDDALPPEVGEFLDPEGNVRAGKIAKFALKGPRNIKMLMTLKSRSDRAVATLQAAWKAISR